MGFETVIIAGDGDVMLEFQKAPTKHSILRFRVSSHLLAAASPYFSDIFRGAKSSSIAPMNILPATPSSPRVSFQSGVAVRSYTIPHPEENQHDALSILLHAAHMHHRKVPRNIDFATFVSVADVCLRYQCTSPLELQVEYQWLPQWLHMANGLDTYGLLLISYTFGLRRIFTRMTKTTILHARNEAEIQAMVKLPHTVRVKMVAVRAAKIAQVRDCCLNAIKDYSRKTYSNEPTRHGSPCMPEFSTAPRCPRKSRMCDAANLGWLMLGFDEMQILPALMRGPVFSLDFVPERSLQQLCDCLRLMPSATQVHDGAICDYASIFRNSIDDIFNSTSGLTLKDVSGFNGWALSKHAGSSKDRNTNLPRDFELNLPELVQSGRWELMPDSVIFKIFASLKSMRDLQSLAMASKRFYAVYENNEVQLLRVLTRKSLNNEQSQHSRTVTFTAAEHMALLAKTGDPISSPTTVSTVHAPTQAQTTMSPEHHRENLQVAVLNAFHTKIEQEVDDVSQVENNRRSLVQAPTSAVERNEKFLASEMMHAESKTIYGSDASHSKFLRGEHDQELRGRPLDSGGWL